MGNERNVQDVQVGARVDGSPWLIRTIEHRGQTPGPSTAILGGMYGDKPMSCLAVHQIDQILSDTVDLCGSVTLVPAANPPALETGTRINSDHFALNRRFPGNTSGFLTDQIARVLVEEILQGIECILDLHSGTPSMALWYTYDFGNLETSSAFGYLPVIEGQHSPGQLGTVTSERGVDLLLPEWGGSTLRNLDVGIEGAMNLMRFRGHLPGKSSGPKLVPLIRNRRLMLASVNGVLISELEPSRVGNSVPKGHFATIVNVTTGATLERFEVEEGEALLLMMVTTPIMVKPGDFVAMIGYQAEMLEVPNS